MKAAHILAMSSVVLSGCNFQLPEILQSDNLASAKYSNDQKEAAKIVTEVQTSLDRLPVKVVEIPTIRGIGFSAVSIQPGKNLNQKPIMAIKAARLDALRQLTEQIHGIQISGSTLVSEAIVESDTLRADLQGVILGARTVKVEPNSSDTYQVIVEIDKPLIDEIVKAYR